MISAAVCNFNIEQRHTAACQLQASLLCAVERVYLSLHWPRQIAVKDHEHLTCSLSLAAPTNMASCQERRSLSSLHVLVS